MTVQLHSGCDYTATYGVLCKCPHADREDDNNWPQPDKIGKQELEVVMGNDHISFTVFIQPITLHLLCILSHAV